MKQIQTAIKFLTVIALCAFAVGCTNQLQEKQNLAVAAGFRSITPSNAKQQTILTQLPADRVTSVNYEGFTYYVLPDAANNQAYVGGAAQYQAYQQLRLANRLSQQNLQAAQMNQINSMRFNTWGGWRGARGWGW